MAILRECPIHGVRRFVDLDNELRCYALVIDAQGEDALCHLEPTTEMRQSGAEELFPMESDT